MLQNPTTVADAASAFNEWGPVWALLFTVISSVGAFIGVIGWRLVQVGADMNKNLTEFLAQQKADNEAKRVQIDASGKIVVDSVSAAHRYNVELLTRIESDIAKLMDKVERMDTK